MTTLPRPEVPVRSSAELTRRFEQLLDPPVFAARSLWLTWLGDGGLMLPMIFPVDDIPLVPDRRMLTGLARIHDDVVHEQLGGDGHLAMALCRPGQPDITGDDGEWAAALHAVLDGRIAGCWSLHVAAGGRVTPLAEAPESAWR